MQVSTSSAHIEIPQVGNKEIRGELPTEIWTKILSLLAPEDMQITCLVNRAWRDMTLVAAQSEGDQIKRFAGYLISNLVPNVYSAQVAQLREIIPSVQLGDAKNLRMVKKSYLEIKEQIAIILKDMNHEMIKDLNDRSDKMSMPMFFENIYGVVSSHIEIDLCSRRQYPDNKTDLMNLEKQFKFLAQSGMNQGAIKALTELKHSERLPMLGLWYLELLVRDEDIENIIKVAQFLITQVPDEQVFLFPVMSLLDKAAFGGAILVFQSFQSKKIKKSIFLEIVKKLPPNTRRGFFLEFKRVFDDKEDKTFTSRNIVKYLLDKARLSVALEFIACDPSENRRNTLYGYLALGLANLGRVDSALDVLEQISDPDEQELNKQAIRTAYQQNERNEKSVMLEYYSDSMKKIGNFISDLY